MFTKTFIILSLIFLTCAAQFGGQIPFGNLLGGGQIPFGNLLGGSQQGGLNQM
jgi:hypothetical protein